MSAIQGSGGDASDFESFRRERTYRRRQREGAVSSRTRDHRRNDMLMAIEQSERKEILECRIRREVQEFVEETTRLAASILGTVGKEQKESISQQISEEMKEFFRDTLLRTQVMLENLQLGTGQFEAMDGVETIETHLKSLATQALDEFRAQGNEECSQLHMGEAPGEGQEEEPPPEGDTTIKLDLHKDPSESTPKLKALGLTTGEVVLEPEEEIHDGDIAFELQSEDFGLETPSSLDEGEGEEVSPTPRASKAWKATSPVEAEVVDLEEEEDPIEEAGSGLGPGKGEEDGPEEPFLEGGGEPSMFDHFSGDPEKLRRALALMVKNGLMTREEARDAYQKALS